MNIPDARFDSAIERLDALHAEDPRQERVEGQDVPHELLYARRMSAWLAQVAPDASDALRLAVRAQHLQRWRIPRTDYPQDRPGYLTWRRDLGRVQAEQAARVLSEVGYEAAFCERVAGMIRKEQLRRDPEAQALEDTACLVFLEHYFADFAGEHDEAKLIRIVRKTWNKMSPRGHELAATIPMSRQARQLVQQALADG
ncbi:protein of unknown function [Modicisalibacter ilicicola DSM 19980]|uniref:DUF4202 domain-containing protein n=1 Tax=Modicisalibacter ilicicola DSM 19980 TaxID=1121942 RepID=A0A1M5BST0_9GAMM|nr:DUF4202 domain-containing protein [Halomonas ilicicola]SHF45476.1 protein of unknown function [Halomonas ilicicola DSM 19980]